MNPLLKLLFLLSVISGVNISGVAASAAEPLAVVEGEMHPDLRELIESTIGSADTPPRSNAQTRRRGEKAQKSAVSVLRSQGYYLAKVDLIVELKNIDDDDTKITRRSILKISPGTQYTYGSIDVEYTGFAPDISSLITDDLGTKSGNPARAADVINSERRIVDTLHNYGFPDAVANPMTAIVDHKTKTMQLSFNITPGVKTQYGQIIRTGTASVSEKWLPMVAPFQPGDVYDVRQIKSLTSRILAPGVFEGTTVSLAPPVSGSPANTVVRDVIVDIEQGKRNTISGEVGVSTSDGTGFDIIYERRNFGRYAQTLALTSTVKTNRISVGAKYKIPYAWRVDRQFDAGVELAREDSDAFTGERFTSNALLTQKFNERLKIGAGAGFEASQFEESNTEIRSYLVEGLARLSYDARDNILDPSKGYLIEADAIPSYNFGDSEGLFATIETDGSIYRKVSSSVTLAGRAKVGTIFGADQSSVPLNRRYYAGGGGSVRGFGYQSISPINALNESIGGRSIVESSLEMRYHGKGPYGFAAFVDAGAVSRSEFTDFGPVRYGAGLGLRYFTAFAPVRADIAIPLNKRPEDAAVQVYISIGQAF